MSQTFIEPSTQIITNIITSFTVTVTDVVLFSSANLLVNLYNADPLLVKTEYMTLTGQAYNDWANDDDYIIQYVATQLGFVITTPPEPPTPDPDPIPPEPEPVIPTPPDQIPTQPEPVDPTPPDQI